MRRRRPRRPGARRHATKRIRVGSGRGSLRTTRRRRRRRRRIRFGVRRVDPVARGDGPGDRAGERVPAHGDNFGKRDGRADHRDERAREHRLARGGGVLAEPPSAGRRRRAPSRREGRLPCGVYPPMPSRSRIFSSARAARLIERLVCAAGLRRELDRSFCSFSRAARPAADRRLPCRELLGCGPRPSSASRNDSRRPEDGGSRYDRCRPRYPMAPCARALRCARERAHRVFFITPRAYNTRNRRNFIDEFMVQAVFEVRLSFTLLSSKNRTCRLLLVLGPRRPPGHNTRRVWRAGTMSSRDAELDAAPEVGPSAKAVASANAKRAAFHADLASGQWGALEKALGAARGPPVPCDAREIRAEVKRFLRLHGQAPGSAPFLLGFRALLEAQGGRTVSVAWRVDPATLTQSGGDAAFRETPSRSCPSLATAARTWRRLSPSLPRVKICLCAPSGWRFRRRATWETSTCTSCS